MAGRSRRSAKRSATRHEDVTFVVDECLGGNLVREALVAEGATVVLVKDEFGEGAKDIDWLPEAGKRGWVVLTKDHRIRRRPIERAAFVAACVRGFFLAARGLSGPEVAKLFADQLPHMNRLVADYEPPFIAILRRDGLVLYGGKDCPAVRRRPGRKA